MKLNNLNFWCIYVPTWIHLNDLTKYRCFIFLFNKPNLKCIHFYEKKYFKLSYDLVFMYF